MKDLNAKQIIAKLMPVLVLGQKYMKFIFFIFFMGLCAFLIYQINQFASVNPSESDVTDKLKTVTRPHIDQASIDQIQKLQDQNVQVQSIVQQARDNPFSE